LLISHTYRHCVGGDESESGSEPSCGINKRDYDVPLRIGTLFVILVTSSIGVFAPILFTRLPFKTFNRMASVVIKQFGTGVIIATAFVHVKCAPPQLKEA
jgi:zinc transporter 1/2/3